MFWLIVRPLEVGYLGWSFLCTNALITCHLCSHNASKSSYFVLSVWWFRHVSHGLSGGCTHPLWTFSWSLLACWWSCSEAENLSGIFRIIWSQWLMWILSPGRIFEIIMHLLQGMELDIDNFDIQTVKLAGIKSLLIFGKRGKVSYCFHLWVIWFILFIQITGLLHDVGHGPFSHLFEREFLPEVRSGYDWYVYSLE